MVVTDGHENASREYQLEAVRNLIAQQRNQYNWVFQSHSVKRNCKAANVSGYSQETEPEGIPSRLITRQTN